MKNRENTQIENARIESTMLGSEDHGIMTCYITLCGDGWVCSYGGFALDTYDKNLKRRVGTAEGMDALMLLMDALEVKKWEDLAGKYVRVETTGWGGEIVKIGHIIKPNWFSFREFFKKCAEEAENDAQS